MYNDPRIFFVLLKIFKFSTFFVRCTVFSKTIRPPWNSVLQIFLLDLVWCVYEAHKSEERNIGRDLTGRVLYALGLV